MLAFKINLLNCNNMSTFKIEVLGESKSGNSWFVKVRESVKSGFGDMETELGIGYITKPENAPALDKGAKVTHNGNIQFAPITDNNGVASMVGGQYLHRVNLVSAEMPFIAPVQAKMVETAKPAVKEEVVENAGGVPGDDDQPF